MKCAPLRLRIFTFLLILASPARPAPAAESGSTATLRGLILIPKDVFDPSVPGEDKWLFRLADKIHINTRQEIIRRELLLYPGEPWSLDLAKESERNLREFSFIKSARIRPVNRTPESFDLEVLTQDSWTLAPEFVFGTRGGEHISGVGLLEKNLLGYGKTISLLNERVGKDTNNTIQYIDPRVLNSHVRFSVIGGNIKDGSELGVLLEHPFFALQTPFAGFISGTNLQKEGKLYDKAQETSNYIHGHDVAEAGAAMRVNRRSSVIQRIGGSLSYERNYFKPKAGTLPGTLPQNRVLSGPSLIFRWLVPRYIEETFINKVERVEDFNLGNEGEASLGYSATAFGSSRDWLTFSLQDQHGISLGEGKFAMARLGFKGRADRQLRNTLFHGSANLYWKFPTRWPQTWILHAEGTYGINLDGENQQLVGGENGLRGYKVHSLSGNKTMLFNVEHRFYLPHEFLHLGYIGGALFFDAGIAEPNKKLMTLRDFKTDVGFGLRGGPTRSSLGLVGRADIAYALNGPPGGGGRWVLSVLLGHAFGTSNSIAQDFLKGPTRSLREDPDAPRLEQ